MFKFCVAPGVNSVVDSHFDEAELYTKTIPLLKPDETSISLKAPNVPPCPASDDTTLIPSFDPTLTLMSAIFLRCSYASSNESTALNNSSLK